MADYHWTMAQSPSYLPTISKFYLKLAITIYSIDYRAQAFLAFSSVIFSSPKIINFADSVLGPFVLHEVELSPALLLEEILGCL